MKKRILALLLCLSMLLPLFTGSVIANDGGDYSSNVGRYAVLSDTYQGVFVGSFTDISTESSEFLYLSDFEPGTIFKITDWYVEPGTSGLWYGVEIYSGGVLPEAQEYWPAIPWILQDYLGEAAEGDSLIFIDVCDTCGKPNCGGHDSTDFTTIYLNGVEVTQITMPQFDKPTLSATTTLEGNVSCRWQILADAESGFWVNIYGENSPELTLSYGMVASLLDSNNQAWVRCVTSAGGTEVISDALPITLEPYVAPQSYVITEEPSEPTEESSEPTEESSEPTEESSEPTEESSEPTEESSEPTEESSEPTEESSEPTEESSEPTEESSEPTEESSEPTEESSEPTGESSEPTAEPHLTQAAMRLLPLGQRIPSSASAVGDDSDDLVQYDITVTYTFESTGTTAAGNYTASVAKGDPFIQTVTFPTVPGYDPYLYINSGWVQMGSYTFDIPSVTEDIFMEVVYRPALVPYHVYVYLQNVDNDGYPTSPTQDSGLAYTGSTNYEFDQEHVKYPGFYQLPYEKPPIAADGSTTVSIYFDRYYYLMKFDQDGGYGAEPIYARYGTPLSVPTPTRAGYEFIGWDRNGDGKADALPATMPHENTSYKALWKEENTVKVTVVFWGENADNEEYSFLPDYTKEVYVKPGTSFTYSETADLVCGYNTEHTHNAGCGLICTREVHTHNEDCYTLICNKTSHSHAQSGCTVECTHSHTLDCYSTSRNIFSQIDEPNYNLTHTGNGIYTYRSYNNTIRYCLNIGDTWYQSNRGSSYQITLNCNHSHSDACYTCGDTDGVHTHSIENNCYDTTPTCGKEVHTHSDLCYNCGQKEHSHSTSCHLDQNRPNPVLWTFIESDTVTVESDGTTVVNVKYDRKPFTLTFKRTGTNGATLATITDKWGSDIKDRFQTICNTNTFLWSQKTSGDSPWTSYLDIMPQENRTYYAKTSSSGSIQTATYYTQKLDGSGYDTYFVSNVKYGSNLTVSEEEFIEIEGYVFNASKSTKTGASYNGAAFYYDLKSFALTFNDGLDGIETKHPMYGQSLAEYTSFVPDPPDIYEPGSVEFDGWYQNQQCTGVEYILSDHTMPASDLLLYAKWKLASHTVQIFPSVEDAQNLTNQIGKTQTILHGSSAAAPEKPTNEPYQFVGWFYTLNGVEHAYDFGDMPVVRDLILYAKWSSNVLVDYTVRYFKEGTTESVAPDTTGSGLAGYPKTFEAVEAPEGWFPTVKSHSITLDMDETNNVCTFYYVQQPAVPYTVRYVTMNDQGIYVDLSNLNIPGAPATKEVADNKKAVVTENFVPVPGYLPDAFQKTLVVSADGKDNVITFIYTKDEVNSYYIVSDWLQNTDGSTWTRNIREEGPGKIGTYYERTSQTIPGFTFDPTVSGTRTKGTLEKNTVLELNFYYTRNKYPYQIRYLEHGTEKVLADPVNYTGDDMAYYGESVNAEGKPIPTIDGYRLHSVVGCTIGMETNVDSLSHNVVKVYYVPVTGNLQITKRISIINDNAPDPSDQEFEFLVAVPGGVTGTYPVTIGGTTENVTVTDGKIKVNLKDGESAIIQGLPQGPSTNKHQYTITETPVPGFNSSFSPAGAVTVSENGTTSVTCTNEYPIGNLKITKTVAKEYDDDVWQKDKFSFTITSDALTATTAGYMVSINGGEAKPYWVTENALTLTDIEVADTGTPVTITIADVPAGSYTVIEKETDALKAAYTTTANGTDGCTATVDVTASETPAAVSFVNTFKRTTGDLCVSKKIEIVPDSGATLDPNAEFTFTVQMPSDQPASHFAGETYTVTEHSAIQEVTVGSNGSFTFKLKHGEHLIIKDLPVGSYVITEAPAKGYASSFPTPNPVDGSVSKTETIVTNEQTKLECINTYPVHVGNLEITKTVQNESGLANVPEDTFTFQVEFTVMGNNLTFPVTYSPAGTKEILTAVRTGDNAVLTVELKDDESVLIERLPEGACTVTEKNIPANYTAEYSSRITIDPDQTQALAVVNKYKPPTLTIQKTNAEAGQVFVYEVQNNATGEIITVTVTGNSSTTIHDLVPGTYTVTQKNLWSWRYSDPVQTVTLPAKGTTVTFSGNIQEDSWLDGNSALVKNQKTGG